MRDVRPGPVKKDWISVLQSALHAAYPAPPRVRGIAKGATMAKVSTRFEADAMMGRFDSDGFLVL